MNQNHHKSPSGTSTLKAQGDSVRETWGRDSLPERKPLRRDPPPVPAALIPTDDLLSLRLAEELEYGRRMLDVMGDALAADPLLVARHMIQLQTVDILGQMLGHIAAVVRSSDPPGAVARIGMCELRARLERKSVL